MVLFAGYIGLQLVRFTQVPAITLQGDRVLVLTEDATTVVLRGTAGATAIVNVSGPDGTIIQSATADDAGAWVTELGVSKGRNDFTLIARDPDTGRESDALAGHRHGARRRRRRCRPIRWRPAASTAPGATPAPAATSDAATVASAAPLASVELLALDAPADGAAYENKLVTVRGTSDASLGDRDGRVGRRG